MDEAEIVDTMTEYGLDSKQQHAMMKLCKEIVRQTRIEYFRFIQHANNSAMSNDLSACELDKLLWDRNKRMKSGN